TVGLGDLERMESRTAVGTAVTRAGATDVVDRLAAGLDTQLGPTWPDGVEVSFGQWQKLALARGFMRDEPLLLVLDEPTAALDAETEHALFGRYAAAVRDNGGAGEGDDRAGVPEVGGHAPARPVRHLEAEDVRRPFTGRGEPQAGGVERGDPLHDARGHRGQGRLDRGHLPRRERFDAGDRHRHQVEVT